MDLRVHKKRTNQTDLKRGGKREDEAVGNAKYAKRYATHLKLLLLVVKSMIKTNNYLIRRSARGTCINIFKFTILTQLVDFAYFSHVVDNSHYYCYCC